MINNTLSNTAWFHIQWHLIDFFVFRNKFIGVDLRFSRLSSFLCDWKVFCVFEGYLFFVFFLLFTKLWPIFSDMGIVSVKQLTLSNNNPEVAHGYPEKMGKTLVNKRYTPTKNTRSRKTQNAFRMYKVYRYWKSGVEKVWRNLGHEKVPKSIHIV